METLIKKKNLNPYKTDSSQILIMSTESVPVQLLTSMRIPIVKKGEYDLWCMKMRQYIAMTDNALWEVIVNGNQVLEEPVVAEGQPQRPKLTLSATVQRN